MKNKKDCDILFLALDIWMNALLS